MFCYSYSAAVHGLDIRTVKVEADVSEGLPMFHLVGFLGSEVKEAKDRVRISVKNSGYYLPAKKVTVNLSPADIRKEGTGFDLAIAMSVLAAYGYLSQECLKGCVLIGETGLDGSLKPVCGVLPMVCAAREKGFTKCLVPSGNAGEGAFAGGIEVIGVSSLKEAVGYLEGICSIKPAAVNFEENAFREEASNREDFADVAGQEMMKRAMEVAAAGMHNLLLIGPPGSGKTMMAKRMPGILPELSRAEAMEISKLYSICGLLDNQRAFISRRPFRAPHHTVTAAALTGGGSIPRPGELSLSCGGILFLDELPEFKKSTLELLRQPLEDRYITIARVNSVCRYPADFMLVAAMNPCNCGYFPDAGRCRCSRTQIERYLGKISRPLLDRFDICAEAPELPYEKLRENARGESSAAIKKRVTAARKRQLERYEAEGVSCNGELGTALIEKYCILGSREKDFLEEVFRRLKLSVRAYHRILKVAKTIADLDGKEEISRSHLSEAVCYRSVDRKYWGYAND